MVCLGGMWDGVGVAEGLVHVCVCVCVCVHGGGGGGAVKILDCKGIYIYTHFNRFSVYTF